MPNAHIEIYIFPMNQFEAHISRKVYFTLIKHFSHGNLLNRSEKVIKRYAILNDINNNVYSICECQRVVFSMLRL